MINYNQFKDFGITIFKEVKIIISFTFVLIVFR